MWRVLVVYALTVAAWCLCWWWIVSAAGRCLLGLCGALRWSPGLGAAAGAVQLRGDCDGVVRRLVRWAGPYVAGCFMAALGAFSRALGLGVGLWA